MKENNRNWKTTACGIVSLVGSMVALYYPEHGRDGSFVAAVGNGVGLMLANDSPKGPGAWRAAKVAIVLAFLSLSLMGCSTANLSRLVGQLKNDPAIVAAKVTSIYGTAQLTRVGGSTNSVTVSPDGTISINRSP